MNARRASVFGILLGLCAVSYFVGEARAGGAPTMAPLVYAGTLLDGEGAPVSAAHTIGLSLWDDETLTATSHRACIVAPMSITPTHGRFTITLDATCTAAVHANPDLWVELFLDTGPMPRTHLGAAPYALEADHAVHSTEATSAARLVLGGPGGQISVALYCGSTPATSGRVSSGGNVGYPAVRELCAAACGAATAHICSADEMSRSVQVGRSLPSAMAHWIDGPYSYYSPVMHDTNNCDGWLTAPNRVGSTWLDVRPSNDACTELRPIACCD